MCCSTLRCAGPLSKKLGVKVRLCISRMNADSQWNPIYNAFHRNFRCDNETIVGTFVNVILTRQTCGQRSSRAAKSKRQALGNCFSKRICYMFLISKCRGGRNLALCTSLVLAFGEHMRSGDFREKKRVSTQEKFDFAIALRFSKRKYRSCAQT